MRKVISIVLFAFFFLGCTTGQKPKENIIKTVKKQNDFAIIIHGGAGTILKKNMTKEGLVPIYIRFILNRKVNRISLNKWVHHEAWIDEGGYFVKEKGEHAPAHARLLNIYLRNFFSSAQEIILKSEKDGKEITFRKFKEELIDNRQQILAVFWSTSLYVRTSKYVCMCVCMYVCVRVCVYACMYARAYSRVCVCVWACTLNCFPERLDPCR